MGRTYCVCWDKPKGRGSVDKSRKSRKDAVTTHLSKTNKRQWDIVAQDRQELEAFRSCEDH